jgi:AcrR family transcriptional regulator
LVARVPDPLFHAEGYSAAQIADIARRAGTTKPTLYARLGNKEQIYLRVVQREADAFKQWIADAYEHGTELPLARLAQVGMEPLFRFAAERAEGFDLLFRGDMTADHPATLRREVVNGVTEQLTNLIERRQQAFGPPSVPPPTPSPPPASALPFRSASMQSTTATTSTKLTDSRRASSPARSATSTSTRSRSNAKP